MTADAEAEPLPARWGHLCASKGWQRPSRVDREPHTLSPTEPLQRRAFPSLLWAAAELAGAPAPYLTRWSVCPRVIQGSAALAACRLCAAETRSEPGRTCRAAAADSLRSRDSCRPALLPAVPRPASHGPPVPLPTATLSCPRLSDSRDVVMLLEKAGAGETLLLSEALINSMLRRVQMFNSLDLANLKYEQLASHARNVFGVTQLVSDCSSTLANTGTQSAETPRSAPDAQPARRPRRGSP